MAHPVVHWEIGGRDLPALRAFYAQAFGWKIDETFALFADPAGNTVGLLQASGKIIG